jgi:hypothetical protein
MLDNITGGKPVRGRAGDGPSSQGGQQPGGQFPASPADREPHRSTAGQAGISAREIEPRSAAPAR